MSVKQTFKTSLIGVKTNKSRSALTILGIVIGITSIILMMSIGQGAENLILDEVAGFGAETIVVRPGQEPTGPTDIGETLFSDSLKERDIEMLKRKENVPDLIDVTSAVIVTGSVSFEGETYRPTIFGGSVRFFAEVLNLEPGEGRFYTENEIRTRANVAVIGTKVREELFGNDEAVGKLIKIKDKKFRVVGVFAKKGQTAFYNFDELVIVPQTTAQVYLTGTNHYHEVLIKVSDPSVVKRAVHDIEATLRESHGITDPEKDDFFVVTQEGVVQQISTIIGALTIFLSSIVAIALVVAGVGVMNIMLVSVTERTREIGLRKAVGATNKNILAQFLFEAMILTGTGGIIGIILGGLLSFIFSIILTQYAGLSWPFSFPIGAAVLGLFVSTLVGLIFGIYPARKAAKKSPIEALRYE
ncbi:MAG: ABC transporter permease [Candidatus Pacebacteria bacterium]|jgi:putative ABC transport system permease protein|nr:ABC transporter permease [Parcubacteria group bacterium]MDP6249625.1 ABC transporter permease [Candidatus Paceibacterota bacterium]MDP7159373.1 ABC transporter permease [Candidatus Paceibacterota bacterium]MDP7366199.1 ABC transporter permease [Candidatus Paceibacterota bacterium]MDP7466264.1 ABC transporter permease [Candidatus Paceibacterota bacterium]|tara:strand:- start:282 stop:1526 length:1245 start_codon:yes stop_codon:yes gene_type:complete